MALASTAATASSQPLWPYIAGGVVSVLGAIYASGRVLNNWRQGIETQAREKTISVEATRQNTDTVKELVAKIRDLSEAVRTNSNRITNIEREIQRQRDRRGNDR